MDLAQSVIDDLQQKNNKALDLESLGNVGAQQVNQMQEMQMMQQKAQQGPATVDVKDHFLKMIGKNDTGNNFGTFLKSDPINANIFNTMSSNRDFMLKLMEDEERIIANLVELINRNKNSNPSMADQSMVDFSETNLENGNENGDENGDYENEIDMESSANFSFSDNNYNYGNNNNNNGNPNSMGKLNNFVGDEGIMSNPYALNAINALISAIIYIIITYIISNNFLETFINNYLSDNKLYLTIFLASIFFILHFSLKTLTDMMVN